MEKRQKGGDLVAFYLKRRPQMRNGTGEALRTLTSPSVVAYLNSTSKTQRSRKAFHRAVAPNSTPKDPSLSSCGFSLRMRRQCPTDPKRPGKHTGGLERWGEHNMGKDGRRYMLYPQAGLMDAAARTKLTQLRGQR